MTVQQETALPVVALPAPRAAGDDAEAPVPAAAPQLRGWGTVEDRTTMRWVVLGMLLLSLFASVMVTLGTRLPG